MNVDDFPFDKVMAAITKRDKVETARLIEEVRLHIRRHVKIGTPEPDMINGIVKVMNVYWKLGVLKEDIRDSFCCVRRSLDSEDLDIMWVIGDGDVDGEYEDNFMMIDGSLFYS